MKMNRKIQEDEFLSKEILKPSNRINTKFKGLIEVDEKDNWLLVRNEATKANFPISKYCRVKDVSYVGSGENKREKFTIIDWPHKGVTATVKALQDRSRFSDVEYNVGAILEFDYKTKKLTVKLNQEKIIVTAGFAIKNLANGEYYLRLADYPHAGGDDYLRLSPFAKTWFFINDSDAVNRYVHTGKYSEGCLTVGLESNGGSSTDVEQWTKIAKILLTQRPPTNDEFVGKLIVKGL